MMQTPLTSTRLADFVAQRIEETLYYSPAWLDLIEKVYGYSITPLISTDAGGHIRGFLPLCLVQSPLTGRRLVALPFSDTCPLLATDAASAINLVDQALRLTHEKQARYLELRTGLSDVLAERPDLVAGNLYVRWLKPLHGDTDLLWRSVDRSVREKINKARRLGVRVRLADQPNDMEQFYRLHLLTRSKKHGMPAQPRRFFIELWRTFSANGVLQLWLAEHEGRVVAASISLASAATVRCAYNASDPRSLHLAPNHLLIWTTMSWAGAKGFQMLDIGRTARDNTGLMDFKRHLGARMEPLPYYYYPAVAGLTSTCETSWRYRLLTACWKRLPLQLAEQLGGHLYRHIG